MRRILEFLQVSLEASFEQDRLAAAVEIEELIEDLERRLFFDWPQAGRERACTERTATVAKTPKDVMLASVEMWTQQVTEKTEARDRAIYLASQEGASLREIMARMGHASAEASLRYLKASERRDAEIASAIEQRINRDLAD